MNSQSRNLLVFSKNRARDYLKCLGVWGHGFVYLMLMLPFGLLRHARIHGDEKVYVGQALEMVRAGHLLQQIQFGDVNYIKGPLYYLLLIMGHHLFGFSMLATVYMNLIFVAVAVVALRAAMPHLIPHAQHLWALPSWVFATCGAYLMFTFSSQMESLLTSLYAITLSLAVLSLYRKNTLHLLGMWLSVGLAGALKSPLHSCLLGISVLTYFSVNGSVKSILLQGAKSYLSLMFGIVVCGAGYFLPFLSDNEQWLESYLFREQIDRPRFADPATGFLLNNFVYHLIPWSVPVIYAAVLIVRKIRMRGFVFDPLIKVSLSFLVPTLFFFFVLGYRASWYGLPMTSAIVLLAFGQFMSRDDIFKDIAKTIIPWTFILLSGVVMCHFSFHGGTSWWTWSESLLLSAIFVLSFLVLEGVASARRIPRIASTFVGVGLFWCGVLGLSATIGGAELADIRALLKKNPAPLNYSNTRKENYSEWGYMAYMTGRPSYFSTTFEELYQAGRSGHWLVFTTKKELDEFWSWLSQRPVSDFPSARAEINLWRRWPRNASQLRELWNERTTTENLWDRVTRHFFVIRLPEIRDKKLAGPQEVGNPVHQFIFGGKQTAGSADRRIEIE